MRRSRGSVLGVVTVVAFLCVPTIGGSGSATAAAASKTSKVRPLLLAHKDVPRGWKKVTPTTSNVTTHLGCVAKPSRSVRGWHHTEAVFADGKGLPFVAETLATGPHVTKAWRAARAQLAGCRSATVTINGKTDHARIGRLPFAAPVATGVIASRWVLKATGLEIGINLFVFRVHELVGTVSYVDAGTADVPDAEAFASAAIAKADARTGTVKGVVTVATAPVRVARTAEGTVGYRLVGSGPPLVLVMGYGGTMDTWEPEFVDALAHHFTVVVFDNAGIGKTAPLAAPLTIDAMAQQTSALITTLHLGAPDVLGWSMGGLVAEALAALHPSQVHRLVLCATYPGLGAVRAPQSAVDDLKAGGTKALDVLFPKGATSAATVFTVTTGAYAKPETTPAKVVAAQSKAILQAWGGKDPGLERYRHITAPTLVADGAEDRLVPPANARTLASGIAGSQLKLYKGAGHAFLFQDLATFVPAVEAFLAG